MCPEYNLITYMILPKLNFSTHESNKVINIAYKMSIHLKSENLNHYTYQYVYNTVLQICLYHTYINKNLKYDINNLAAAAANP